MLYLHIGTPKTGTSSIQRFLTDHDVPHRQVRAFGTRNAVKLAMAAGTEEARGRFERRQAYDGPNGLLGTQSLDEMVDDLWDDAEAEASAHPGRDFIASSECIWSDFGTDEHAIGRLAKRLKGLFGRVVVIFYVRDQRSWVKSYHGQMVKGKTRWSRSFADVVRDSELLADWCDYAARIDLWAAAFGKPNIRAIPFDRRNFTGASLLTDFLARVDIDDANIVSRAMAFRESNRSPTYRQINLLRLLNRLGIAKKSLAVNGITRKWGGARYPAAFDDRILRASTPGNARLNAEYFADCLVKLPTA